MRVFVSYPKELRGVAEDIAVKLTEAGQEPFFDRDKLPAGEEYTLAIRDAIRRSHLMVFLVAPETVDPRSYTLTELGYAEERWKRARRHVLPVIVAPIPESAIPSYLTGVTRLEPKGNLVAETVAAVDRLAKLRRFRIGGASMAGIAAVIAAVWVLAARIGPTWDVSGSLIDASTGGPVAGATIEVRQGQDLRAAVRSESDGKFRASFRRPVGAAPMLFVHHDDYVDKSEPLASNNARLPFVLLPNALRPCAAVSGKRVVVGHFAVSGGASLELPKRIADVLQSRLLPRLQSLDVPPGVQPIFLACDEADPRSESFAGSFASALGAEAFISGMVARRSASFDVVATIGDPYGFFVPPARDVNQDVALEDPAVAQLGPGTSSAVLAALAKGCAERHEWAPCVQLAQAAEELSPSPSESLANLRKECEGNVDVAPLRRDGGVR